MRVVSQSSSRSTSSSIAAALLKAPKEQAELEAQEAALEENLALELEEVEFK